ncbi:MAG TPA: undecaprenyl-phosphate glucose phosphotransferase [Pirellulaceae bacterium]|nr:undecaprenyl-phosphate glucose phosphotransferase [Pirellulaceae bacterium]
MTANIEKKAIYGLASHANALFRVVDWGAIAAGLMVTIVWFPALNSKSTALCGLVAAILFTAVGDLLGVYRNWRGVRFSRIAVTLTGSWLITSAILMVFGLWAQASRELSWPGVLVWHTSTLVFLLGFRVALRCGMAWTRRWTGQERGFAVVGVNDLGIDLVRSIQELPELGLTFRGFFDDRPRGRRAELPSDMNLRLGNLDHLVEQARSGEIPVVFITLPMRAEQRIREITSRLADSTASVYIVPDLFVFQLMHSRWTDIQGIPIVSVYENPFYGVDGAAKRLFDLTATFALLALAALPMLAIALAIKLTSRGPVFFRQRRFGLDGKEFLVWKFRTMHCMDNGPEVRQATKNDPRLTPLGGLLRSTSLDELPQLFNVVAGQMSLVGPRPHATAHNEYYRRQIDGYMLRHKVKPGITGLAQVNGCRGETEQLEQMARRVDYDHKYIRHWSFWLDLKILWQTLWIVLRRQNAY